MGKISGRSCKATNSLGGRKIRVTHVPFGVWKKTFAGKQVGSNSGICSIGGIDKTSLFPFFIADFADDGLQDFADDMTKQSISKTSLFTFKGFYIFKI